MSKHYLVVGGSHGIGLEICRKLLQQGNEVTVISRTLGELSEWPGVTHHALDVSVEEIPASLIPENLHGLVYCPGSINLRAFASLPLAAFREDFENQCIGGHKKHPSWAQSLEKKIRGVASCCSAR